MCGILYGKEKAGRPATEMAQDDPAKQKAGRITPPSPLCNQLRRSLFHIQDLFQNWG
jgi:hypothetical protein